MKPRLKLALSLSVPTLLLVGCPAPRVGMVTPPAAPLTASFSGTVEAPSGMPGVITQASAGLVSAYHITALAQTPAQASYVYLSDPTGRIYTYQGQQIATNTDSNGNYSFGAELPANLPVVVNAVLPNNLRLVSYGLSRAGTNSLNVNLASTMAADLLMQEASEHNVAISTFDLGQLGTAISQTQAMLDSSAILPASSSLTTGNTAQLTNFYVSQFGTSDQALSSTWGQILGYRPIPLTTFIGNGLLQTGGDGGPAASASIQTPWGVATTGSASSFTTYLMQQGGNDVRVVNPAGVISDLFAPFVGDPTVNFPNPPNDTGSGTPASTYTATRPHLGVVDAFGNLIFNPNNTGATDYHILLMDCLQSGTYYGRTMTAGNVYRLGSYDSGPQDGSRPDSYGDAGDNSPVYSTTGGGKFRYIEGLALDDANDLFVADSHNNVIRLINHQTGVITTIAGQHATPDSNFLLTPPGYPTSTYGGDGGPASAATFFWPTGVAYRRVNASTEELYIIDSLNNRIRKITATNGNWASGIVTTVAGTGVAGYSGDGEPATLAQVDFGSAAAFDQSSGGIAMDAAHGYLYFIDDKNDVVRKIDLNTGLITTVAGTGKSFSGSGLTPPSGEATQVPLDQPVALCVAPDGSVLISDYDNNTVRRLCSQWGYK